MPESDLVGGPPADRLLVTVGGAVAAAACFAAAFAPLGWWPLILLVPAILGRLAIGARSRRVVFLATWAAFAAAWFGLQSWLMDVAAPGWPILAAYLGLWPAAFTLLVRSARPGGRLATWPRAAVVGLAWGGLEVARGVFLFDGYPWYLLVHPLVEWPPLVQSAAWLGAFFTSGLVAVVSGGLLDAGALWRSRRAGVGCSRPALAGASLAAGLAIGLPLHGVLALRSVDAAITAAGPGPQVVLVQTGLRQDNKVRWSFDQKQEDVLRWSDLTLAAVRDAGAPPAFIAWPETMLPGYGFDPATRATLADRGFGYLDGFAAFARQLATASGTTLLAGATHVSDLTIDPLDADGRARLRPGREANVVYRIPPDPADPVTRAEKLFLTPFGETMPYISAWPWLEKQLLGFGARGMRFVIAAGESAVQLEIDGAGPGGRPLRVAAPICFEATVPAVVHRLVHRAGPDPADLILNASNDGWFGRSAGRRRHAQIARFRAIEHRRPVVRAVNTGHSMVIDSGGRIVSRLGAGHYGTADLEGTLLAEVPLDGRPTLYGRVGPRWPWASLAALLILIVLAVRPRRGAPE